MFFEDDFVRGEYYALRAAFMHFGIHLPEWKDITKLYQKAFDRYAIGAIREHINNIEMYHRYIENEDLKTQIIKAEQGFGKKKTSSAPIESSGNQSSGTPKAVQTKMEDLENLNAVEMLRTVLDRMNNLQNEVNTLRKRIEDLHVDSSPPQELHNKMDDSNYDLKSITNKERMENFCICFRSVSNACIDLEQRLSIVEANVEILAKSELKRSSNE